MTGADPSSGRGDASSARLGPGRFCSRGAERGRLAVSSRFALWAGLWIEGFSEVLAEFRNLGVECGITRECIEKLREQGELEGFATLDEFRFMILIWGI